MRFLVWIAFLFVSTQSWTQEPHKKNPEAVEELLLKENPEAFYSKLTKNNYLVLDRYRQSKRIRYYIGNDIHFKSIEFGKLSGQITEIKDSSFTIALANNEFDRTLLHTTPLTDITKIYKNRPYKGIRLGWTWATPAVTLPIFYDWAIFRISPLNNRNGWFTVLGLEAARIIVVNHKKYFNKIKINQNNQLKVFKSY